MLCHRLLSVLAVLALSTCGLAAGARPCLAPLPPSLRQLPVRHWQAIPLHPPSAADSIEERLQYSPGGASGRFVPLGNLTIGGTPTNTVCLCTDRSAPPDAAGGK